MGTYLRAKVMDGEAAKGQINHMREFILHEAKEKADEIEAKAEQDYTVEKQRLVEEEKLRIKKELERREENVSLETKIASATETNKKKLQVLASAAAAVDATFDAAFDALKNVPKDKSNYTTLCASMISQGAEMMGLKECVVICLSADKGAVQAAASQASGASFTVKDDDAFMKSAVAGSCKYTTCIGGVVIASPDNKVFVNQTLNGRLQVAYETALPVIKPKLFNQMGSKHSS